MQLIQGNLRTVLLTLTLAMTLLLAAAVPSFAAEQPKLVVGGKNFTEQYIMAHVVAELLKAHGFDVEVKAGLGSGDVIFGALQRGEIDMYVEYSGTAWTGFLKEEISVGVDPDLLYQQTAAGMKERFGMEFLPERTIGFSNTYVFVVTRETAEKYNLSKVSDLIPIADQLTLGGTIAFMGDRPDGIRGAEQTYGFKFRRNRAMDHALLFQALQLGQVDAIVAFSTDGQIAAMDLVMLEDDRGTFPPYHAGVLVRGETLEKYPEIRDILAKLEGLIDEHTMATLNYEVDGNRRNEREVALEFLREQGLVE
ncbi:MAG TPA: glycine betaine ABC transporter substrate-binding protein [Limnochordia bacterium]|nr:glycine betaine ABC transporter substrate-binding protein [Limnochordia bacterium]